MSRTPMTARSVTRGRSTVPQAGVPIRRWYPAIQSSRPRQISETAIAMRPTISASCLIRVGVEEKRVSTTVVTESPCAWAAFTSSVGMSVKTPSNCGR